MNNFTIQVNKCLKQDIYAYYHTNFYGYDKPNNPNYLNTLKNTYNDFYISYLNKLKSAVQELKSVLLEDLPQILEKLQVANLTVCVVPRAKAEDYYQPNQLMFKSTVKSIVNEFNGFIDGTDYIIRHTDTKTTHLKKPKGLKNDGKMPYPGITTKTCNISDDVNGKDILLIDDIYTKSINIDEDVIQALLNKGAKSVTFYAIGRTVNNNF